MPATSSQAISIRRASVADAPLILRFIKELAEYERMSDEVTATVDQITDRLFGTKPAAEALIGEVGGEPAGFALYFQNFSTFLARPGIYLEDLYVRPAARRLGLGAALLARLAKLAVERDCGRLEWAVLDWNQPAMDFYSRLGARPMHDWTVWRLSGEALRLLAE